MPAGRRFVCGAGLELAVASRDRYGYSHDTRNMKLSSEMLLEVTVYCGKVRDQRGCQNMKYTTVEAS